jgi:hypothetical protein
MSSIGSLDSVTSSTNFFPLSRLHAWAFAAALEHLSVISEVPIKFRLPAGRSYAAMGC